MMETEEKQHAKISVAREMSGGRIETGVGREGMLAKGPGGPLESTASMHENGTES